MIDAPIDRPRLLARALRLEYVTVGWNIVEGVVAIAAAMASGCVALLGFGIDSFVETASGSVMIWRLLAERNAARTTRRSSGSSSGLSDWCGCRSSCSPRYIAFDSVTSLITGERPEPSLVGIVLAATSLAVMWWLAREKRRVGIALGSRALDADAFQTDACFWLSLFLLVGIGANALFGWWWADPVAALGMTVFIGREALEAWRGERTMTTVPSSSGPRPAGPASRSGSSARSPRCRSGVGRVRERRRDDHEPRSTDVQHAHGARSPVGVPTPGRHLAPDLQLGLVAVSRADGQHDGQALGRKTADRRRAGASHDEPRQPLQGRDQVVDAGTNRGIERALLPVARVRKEIGGHVPADSGGLLLVDHDGTRRVRE